MNEPPLLRHNPKKKAAFDAKDFIRYDNQEARINSEYCILSHFNELVRSVMVRYNGQQSDLINGLDLHIFNYWGYPVGISNVGLGAPSAVMHLEELIALGFSNFLHIGAAGALQPNLSQGSYILPTRAIRDEGTSYHYVNPSEYSYPDQSLLENIRDELCASNWEYNEGTVWTTDAFYRETVYDISRHRDQGVLCADMEASALYVVGRYRNIRIASIFYVSDVLEIRDWNPGFNEENIRRARHNSINVALNTFARIREGG